MVTDLAMNHMLQLHCSVLFAVRQDPIARPLSCLLAKPAVRGYSICYVGPEYAK